MSLLTIFIIYSNTICPRIKMARYWRLQAKKPTNNNFSGSQKCGWVRDVHEQWLCETHTYKMCINTKVLTSADSSHILNLHTAKLKRSNGTPHEPEINTAQINLSYCHTNNSCQWKFMFYQGGIFFKFFKTFPTPPWGLLKTIPTI